MGFFSVHKRAVVHESVYVQLQLFLLLLLRQVCVISLFTSASLILDDVTVYFLHTSGTRVLFNCLAPTL